MFSTGLHEISTDNDIKLVTRLINYRWQPPGLCSSLTVIKSNLSEFQTD